MSNDGETMAEGDPVRLLFSLWTDPWAWRHRLVYRVAISTVTHARVESHYQLVMPPGMWSDAGFMHDSPARVLLPLSWRPKQLLLNVRADSSSGEAVHLLTRTEIATLHADQLVSQLSEASRDADVETWQRRASTLEAVARTMSRRAGAFREQHGGLRDPGGHVADLADGLGLSVSRAMVEDWQRRLTAVEPQLPESGGISRDENIASNFLLAVPEVAGLDSEEAIDEAVTDYIDTVQVALALGHDAARRISRLGVEWPLIVTTTVAPGVPLTLTFEEDRPWVPGEPARGSFRLAVPSGDAASLHVETQLLDSAVLIEDVKMLEAGGQEFPLAEDVRDTPDRHAVYISAPERPIDGVLHVTIKLAAEVRAANRFVGMLAAWALLAAMLGRNDVGLYGLLVIPVSLALSVVQVRERTSLVRSLTVANRWWLVGLALALWATVVLRVMLQSPGGSGLFGVF